MHKRHPMRALMLFAGLAISAIVICPMIGSEWISWKVLFSAGSSMDHEIFLRVRLPRMFLALLVGATLGVSGAVFQSLFRNALASPFTLGTASGGTFGAVCAIKFGLDFSVFGFSSVTIAAFLGSLIAIAIVYRIGRQRGGITTSTMLLAGVITGFFFSALTMFLHFMMDFSQSRQTVVWTMGSLAITEYAALVKIAPFILVSQAVVLSMARSYNQLCLGEEMARTRGVHVERVKTASFVVTSIMIGAAVSVAGPIGFVGLIVPHTLRLILGADYRLLLPASLLGGGAFLVVCDTIARVVVAPSELPVGVITALLGGPFFIFLLLKKSPESF